MYFVFKLLTNYYHTRVNTVRDLVLFWEKAIALRRNLKFAGHMIAEMAMSVGSKFDDDFRRDDLLLDIHHEFGALEAEPYSVRGAAEASAKTEKYWLELSKKIQEAKKKYT